MGLRAVRAVVAILLACGCVIPAVAQEVVSYNYDAFGRLIGTSTTGSINSGLTTTTTFDAASNRTSYNVAGVQPPPSLSVADATANEGGTLSFVVTRSGSSATAVSVSYSTADGSATSPADYTAASGTVSFAAGETSKTITVSTVDDPVIESTEVMTLNLAAPTGGATLGTASATGTILDNDSSFAIAGATATEGGALVFTVTRSGATTSAASVNYATANGSAIAPDDYTATSGTLNFAAGQTSATISVVTVDDTVVESTETMAVSLSGATSGATIATSSATGTILDNDVAPAYLAIGNASATEGGNLVFTVSRTGNTGIAASAIYSTASGSAIAGTDFGAVSGSVSFAAGESTKTITVATIDDNVVESTETMTIALSSPSANTTIATASGTGTILDNDSSFSISNASATEGGNLVFTVSRAGTTTSAASVNYATADGSAAAGSDYNSASGTLNFAAGQTSATISVSTLNDSFIEGSETFAVNLYSPSANANILSGSAIGVIGDVAWSATITSGSSAVCYKGCLYQYGYSSAGPMGSLSNTSLNGATITMITSFSSKINFALNGSGSAPANSGWSQIYVPGVGTLQRSAAIYSTSGTTATWSWVSAAVVTSGTVTIQ
ncbi:MAG: hypothetical protein KGM17_07045 [Sphingomonadales bacterium]|nr:hypothetical protein [Sphingomonadales bacterium]